MTLRNWHGALRGIKNDREQVPQPKLTWVRDDRWQQNGRPAFVCRDKDGSFLGAVYLSGVKYTGVYSPDPSTLNSFSLSLDFERSPYGLRKAQVALEQAIEAYRVAAPAQAA